MTRSHKWTHRSRIDLILWDDPSFLSELTKDLKIGPNIESSLRKSILTVIQDIWDSFCEYEASYPMFDFELCINIGYSKPTLCYQLAYNIHERKIMNTYIQILEANDWICGCEAPWWSLILLAPESHQEGWSDTNDFIWRLCVSYCPLNSVTKSFEFPIPAVLTALKISVTLVVVYILFL